MAHLDHYIPGAHTTYGKISRPLEQYIRSERNVEEWEESLQHHCTHFLHSTGPLAPGITRNYTSLN